MTKFGMELYDTIWERDEKIRHDGFIGATKVPRPGTQV